MDRYKAILKEYWGYDDFRPLQGDIIRSVGEGHDTVGLMPTGGGKSLTFQVPAMLAEGICLVITPLVALMKDQVQNLRQRGIKAAAIFSGMSRDEIIITMENCQFGNFKFLYISPERLSTELFQKRIKLLKISMIAVDEAHCISQWGYDFRPSYLKISEVRNMLPEVPVLALTATATPEVVKDIQEELQFEEGRVFQKSFERDNLAYLVINSENKAGYLLRILNQYPGTSVVYVRNRNKTKEIADWLNKKDISADYFHAGLSNAEKDRKQKAWTEDEIRVMVSTNAFGMGIDKPDVRTVIHVDVPDSPEAYFQEAGRGGRDGEKSRAFLIYSKNDITKIKRRIGDTFPPKEFVVRVYEALGNYFQIAVGSGLDRMFDFNINDFCSKFKMPVVRTFNALKILERGGYLVATEESENSSRLYFLIDRNELYRFEMLDEDQEALLHVILRSYSGLFSQFVYINEDVLAKRLNSTREKIYQCLVQLDRSGMVKYIPRKRTPMIIYTIERLEEKYVELNKEVYDERKERFESRINAMVEYVTTDQQCRSKLLLSYFGQKNAGNCGQCDVCLNKEYKKELSDESLLQQIRQLVSDQNLMLEELLIHLPIEGERAEQLVRWAIDNEKLTVNEHGFLKWKPD